MLIKQQKNNGFQKGKSGNPSGRPKGSGKVGELRSQIGEALPEIIDVLIQAAKNGDIQASRLLVDKVIPGVKPQLEPVLAGSEGDSISRYADSVMRSLMRGEISPDCANAMLNTASNCLAIQEYASLEGRIATLEKMAR